MEQYLTQEIKDYILRLHWAGFQFSAIAFKVNNAYHFSVTREMVDRIISENLSRKTPDRTRDSSAAS
jgi:hypothetical protein